jgi:hypothetical protein
LVPIRHGTRWHLDAPGHLENPDKRSSVAAGSVHLLQARGRSIMLLLTSDISLATIFAVKSTEACFRMLRQRPRYLFGSRLLERYVQSSIAVVCTLV